MSLGCAKAYAARLIAADDAMNRTAMYACASLCVCVYLNLRRRRSRRTLANGVSKNTRPFRSRVQEFVWVNSIDKSPTR